MAGRLPTTMTSGDCRSLPFLGVETDRLHNRMAGLARNSCPVYIWQKKGGLDA